MSNDTAKVTVTHHTEVLDKVMQATLDKVVMKGDCSTLSDTERGQHYRAVCESLGLNAITEPFKYLTLNGKQQLYATKSATDQLRRKYGVSIVEMTEENRQDVYIVTATARTADGRTDKSKGAVTIANLKGDALANAIMKAETKAKRRVTLSICGLGMLDESEIETIPGARPVVDTSTVPPNIKTEVVDKAPQQIIDAAIDPIASIHTTDDLISHYKKQAANVKTDARFVEALSARKLAILTESIDQLAYKLGYDSVAVGMLATEIGIDMENMNAGQAQKLADAMTKQLEEKNSEILV